ncbi:MULTISPECIES: Dps family protein [unclassified Microbacterium]|uniref:Dps family protein n=1 Tax=unclassified Microbacterium TaxID=2609290 RepID=UPI00097F1EAF|nr:DNA starvation/stationary phase protection protein [Microbacterium sp. JB110]RCS62832.1 DNA starvation/stationary phase protection protein [Microbacterium sp. JB110]SJM62264.1 Non-specific DNA-binding protein Dps / Iron-binding ferritin-like antioxidant protein / Ferroxidase [Frigoribacterium sp. JB110]
MTNQTIATTASDPTVAAGTSQFLAPVVLGLQALTLNGKQAHWHVRGPNFVGVHEFLDTVVSHAGEWADTAAERIVALGLPIDARANTVGEKAAATKVGAGFEQSEQVIRSVIADMDAIIADTQAAIDGLDEVDLTSQDIAIGIKAGLEKDRWFLFSHLAS